MTQTAKHPGDGNYVVVTTGVQLCTTGKATDRNYLGGIVIIAAGTSGSFAVYDGTSTGGVQIWGTASTAALGAFSGNLNWPAYTGLYAVAAAGGTMNVKFGEDQ